VCLVAVAASPFWSLHCCTSHCHAHCGRPHTTPAPILKKVLVSSILRCRLTAYMKFTRHTSVAGRAPRRHPLAAAAAPGGEPAGRRLGGGDALGRPHPAAPGASAHAAGARHSRDCRACNGAISGRALVREQDLCSGLEPSRVLDRASTLNRAM
jgi:hypothetical protein